MKYSVHAESSTDREEQEDCMRVQCMCEMVISNSARSKEVVGLSDERVEAFLAMVQAFADGAPSPSPGLALTGITPMMPKTHHDGTYSTALLSGPAAQPEAQPRGS